MRKNESGAVVSYVIGAVLLVMVVIGGIYFAHQRGSLNSQATLELGKEATETTQNQANNDNESKEAEKASNEKTEADKKAEEDAQAKVAADEKKKAEEAKKAEEEKAQAAEDSPAATESTPMERQEVATAGNLPTTGPVEDILASVVGLIALVGAGYVYYHFGRK
jgi:LPXTG-motif cell wall-anchored protein